MTFDDFWAVYPRRVAKLRARKAWKKATEEYSADDIIEGAKWFAAICASEGKEAQFIPHPATWLNDGRWLDDGKLNLPDLERDGANRAIADAIKRGQRIELVDKDRLRELVDCGYVTDSEIERAYG